LSGSRHCVSQGAHSGWKEGIMVLAIRGKEH